MTNKLDPWYISGFIDGEGCFCLIVNTEKKKRRNFVSIYRYWVADFSIHLRGDDAEILLAIQRYFDAGRVNQIRLKSGVFAHFNIRDRLEILSSLIPHFEKYPLQAKKQKDFVLWKEAILILETAKKRKKSAFSSQCLTGVEEDRLLEIREALASRLTGKQRENFDFKNVSGAPKKLREVHEMYHMENNLF